MSTQSYIVAAVLLVVVWIGVWAVADVLRPLPRHQMRRH